jgi:adenylate cyclase
MSVAPFSALAPHLRLRPGLKSRTWSGARVWIRGGLAACLVTGLLFGGSLEWIELKALDAQFRLRGARAPLTPIVLIAIDEDSFDEFDQTWPWPRSLHGELIDRLSRGKPAVIGLDILFSEPSLRGADDDQALARAIAAAGNVVLAAGLTVVEQAFVEKRDLNLPVDALRERAAGVGVINLGYDEDAFVRRATLRVAHQELVVPSLALAVHGRAVAAGIPSAPLPAETSLLIDYAGGRGTFPTVSYYRVIRDEIPPEAFRDKIVLVGATSALLHDVFPAPFAADGAMPGVEIHANILETLFRGASLTRISRWALAALAVAAGVFAAWVTGRARPLLALAIVAGSAAGFASVAFAGFAWGRYWTDQVPVLLTLALGYMVTTVEHAMRARRDRQRLSRFFAPTVLRQIVEQRAQPGRSRRLVTVLFSDIRGFTPLAERLEPEEVAEFLGDHMTSMTEAVFAHGGIVVQFVGDEIMALFNAPFDQRDHQIEAVRTGLELQRRVREVSDRWMARCGSPVRIGVGIHTGEAVVGLVGSAQRVEYGAIGDTINLGSRLQGLTKEYGAPVIISETTYQAVRHLFACRLLGNVAVRGRAIPVGIYAVDGGGQVRATRVPIERRLTLTEAKGDAPVSVVCSLSDLSLTGVRASEVPRRFDVGQVVHLTFEPPGHARPISTIGEIVWSDDGRAGIKFVQLAETDERVIGSVVNTRANGT